MALVWKVIDVRAGSRLQSPVNVLRSLGALVWSSGLLAVRVW